MKKTFLSIVFISVLLVAGRAQQSIPEFDSVLFNKHLEFAEWLVEYEYFTQLAIGKISNLADNPVSDWFSYKENNQWHTVGGSVVENTFLMSKLIIIDSLYSITDYTGSYDTLKLNAAGLALSQADKQFQLIRDTSNIYFNSFLICNPDKTISIWYLPAFQPSGQAIYGCEWEYVFNETGKILLTQKSYSNRITAVWIGQPRELWLNYRNTDTPTVGSLYFVQSFRDYFTRIRIDTRISISTISKDINGNYTWSHKMK